MGKLLQSLGGSGRAKVLEKWKETTWTLELRDNEIVCHSNRKRKPEHAIIQSTTNKQLRLEEELKETTRSLKGVTNQLHALEDSSKRFSAALRDKGEPSSTSRRKKAWSDCSVQYQRKKRREIASDVKTALSFTENEDFAPIRVDLVHKDTGDVLSIEQDGSTEIRKATDPECSSDDIVDKTLYIKDRFNVSNQTYHELAMVNKELPRSSALTKRARELGAESIIHPTPGKNIGVQQSLKERLMKRIEKLVQVNPSIAENANIHVKITGDGTCISHSMHAVVIAFTVIEDGENPNSPCGNHTIVLLNAGEDYNKLAESLEDIQDEIKQLKSITVNDVVYTIEFFLGADWKFLALCVGIEAANAKYSCIWCTCPSESRHDTSKTWSITNETEGAQTIKKIQDLAKLTKRGAQKYSCARQPLFPSICIDHVIPDVLHLFLRICNALINLLILELRRLDGIDKCKLHTFDRSAATHVAKYEQFLKEKCKISFHMYVDKDSKVLKWRDLTGPEKHKLLKHIDITNLFPRLPQAPTVQAIWIEFREIYFILQSSTPLNKDSVDSFKDRVKKWMSLFLTVYQTKRVTPYMHLLVSHVPQFLEMYGTLAPFSQQGLEKLNDDLTKDYFRSTNHRDSDALKQMLLKLSRIEDLTDRECSRPKHLYTCRICNCTGHNARTCELRPSAGLHAVVLLSHRYSQVSVKKQAKQS